MKKIYSTLLAVVLLQFSAAWGQVTFPYVIQKSGSIGMSVYGEADFNQDGFKDLATSSLFNCVFIFSGKDFSLLDSVALIRSDADNYALTSIDSDSDGFPDLVVADNGGVRVYSVKKKTTLFYKGLYRYISCLNNISDLNGDGVEDILAGWGF